ncbi:hypothetical protein C8035_v008316 [Colletotrichum spinosum]|uniref:Uncharacterized protein n=1 Tax=Colletotrichum spinosum TaxID=1347390 RepID=A0A4R8QJY1_9PEZI|nr:hypothetical protein C8035_v008316 [Colletotrichum spinosum]
MNFKQLNPADVQSLTTWPKHPGIYLDHPVSGYRLVLDSWVKGRQEGICIFVYTEAPEPIERPELDLPYKEYVCEDLEGNLRTLEAAAGTDSRQEERRKGNVTLEWQRPPHNDARSTKHIADCPG